MYNHVRNTKSSLINFLIQVYFSLLLLSHSSTPSPSNFISILPLNFPPPTLINYTNHIGESSLCNKLPSLPSVTFNSVTTPLSIPLPSLSHSLILQTLGRKLKLSSWSISLGVIFLSTSTSAGCLWQAQQ